MIQRDMAAEHGAIDVRLALDVYRHRSEPDRRQSGRPRRPRLPRLTGEVAKTN